MSDHGYVAYTRGCRCAVCREAKASYMRERRAEARRAATWRSSNTPTHAGPGSWSKYDEQGCRCRGCVQAKNWKRHVERLRQQVREVNGRYEQRRSA